VAGRVDDYLVSLRAASIYSLQVSLNQYWSPSIDEFDFSRLPDGNYRITAHFEGKGAGNLNLDTPGIALMNFWIGTVESHAFEFEIKRGEIVR
jgi:hypothetical protein